MRWIVLTLLLVGCRERFDSYSKTLQQARPLIENGWLPSGLPPSASDIRERHDLDTNETWATFAFSASERSRFEGELIENDETIAVRRPGVSWWPAGLLGSVRGEALRRQKLVAYRSRSRSGAYFFVDWEQGRAYYWSPGR